MYTRRTQKTNIHQYFQFQFDESFDWIPDSWKICVGEVGRRLLGWSNARFIRCVSVFETVFDRKGERQPKRLSDYRAAWHVLFLFQFRETRIIRQNHNVANVGYTLEIGIGFGVCHAFSVFKNFDFILFRYIKTSVVLFLSFPFNSIHSRYWTLHLPRVVAARHRRWSTRLPTAIQCVWRWNRISNSIRYLFDRLWPWMSSPWASSVSPLRSNREYCEGDACECETNGIRVCEKAATAMFADCYLELRWLVAINFERSS